MPKERLRSYHPAKFAKIWISLLKFKCSQILLGDKNETSLCSKIISTLAVWFGLLNIIFLWERKYTKNNNKIVYFFFCQKTNLQLFEKKINSFSWEKKFHDSLFYLMYKLLDSNFDLKLSEIVGLFFRPFLILLWKLV